MPLTTEADRREAFIKVYGQRPELSPPLKPEPIDRGFDLITFNEETNHALFRMKGDFNPVRVVEYAQGPLLTPVRREQFSFTDFTVDSETVNRSLRLASATLDYPLKDGTAIEWHLSVEYRHEKPGTIPPMLPTLEVKPRWEKDAVLLAKCWYQFGSLVPTIIAITASSVEEAEIARSKMSGQNRWEVPNPIYLRLGKESNQYDVALGTNYAGSIPRPKGKLSVADLPFYLELEDSDKQMRVKEIGRNGDPLLEFSVPRFHSQGFYEVMRDGNWQDYVALTEDYPVQYEPA